MDSKRLFNIKKRKINHLDLISIHIPKTGGRSFYEILKFVYGNKLDNRTKRNDFFSDNQLIAKPLEVSSDVLVLHGHLYFNEIIDHIGQKTKLITWLREPVDRVISNYYFFMYRISTGKVVAKQLSKAGLSLLEYARLESERNIMSQFLEGSEFEDFYFVGDFNNYQQEVISLGKLLDWPERLPEIFENKTADLNIFNSCKTKPLEITSTMRNQIAELNQKDMSLYKKCLKLK